MKNLMIKIFVVFISILSVNANDLERNSMNDYLFRIYVDIKCPNQQLAITRYAEYDYCLNLIRFNESMKLIEVQFSISSEHPNLKNLVGMNKKEKSNTFKKIAKDISLRLGMGAESSKNNFSVLNNIRTTNYDVNGRNVNVLKNEVMSKSVIHILLAKRGLWQQGVLWSDGNWNYVENQHPIMLGEFELKRNIKVKNR